MQPFNPSLDNQKRLDICCSPLDAVSQFLNEETHFFGKKCYQVALLVYI